jgi:hypothetical protein
MPAHRRIPSKNQRVSARDLVEQRNAEIAAERTAKRAANKRAKAGKDKEQTSRQQVKEVAHAGDQKIRMSSATAEEVEASARQYLRSEFEKILPELRHLSEEAQAEGLFEELRRWIIDEILSDDPYAKAAAKSSQ